MKRPTKLEPQILDYLKEYGVCKKDLLVEYLHHRTGVSKDKITSRIEKMIKKEKITSIANLLYLKDPTKVDLETDFDEKIDYGPIRLARKGNVVSLRSKWDIKDHDKFKKTIEESLPALKKEVEDGFRQIESLIISEYDPLNALANISAKNSFLDPSIDTESSFQGKQLFTETIQNIVLKNKYETYTHIDSQKDPSQIEDLLKKLDGLFFNYLSSELLVKPDFTPVEKDVFFRVLHTFLIIRGDAYPVHYKEISLELFANINDALKEKGFTIEEYWETVEEIKNQIENNYNEPIQMIKEEHAHFLKFIDHEDNKGKNPKEIMELYRKDQKTRREEINSKMKKLSEILQKESFEIQINEKINVPLIDLLSMEFGENVEWQSPLDMSEIPIKPIIRLNEKYYCFILVHLIRNSIPIVESLLSGPEKVDLNYSKIKGDYFEEKTLFILRELVDGQAYHSLQYPTRTEIDGVVVKDDTVFLVEVKGKKRRIIAGADDILSLTKDDFRAHISGAFGQTKRAYDYIYSKDEAEFRNNEGETVLKLRKDDISRVYLVTVSLASFSELSLDLSLVKSWDPQLIVGEEYPWIVNIYDLMVLNDLFEKGNDSFIDYLNQRIEIVKTIDLKALDELDFLGYFLDYGNLTKTENIRKLQSPIIHGFSEKIDKWYYYLSGYIDEAEKPIFSK